MRAPLHAEITHRSPGTRTVTVCGVDKEMSFAMFGGPHGVAMSVSMRQKDRTMADVILLEDVPVLLQAMKELMEE